MAKKTKMLIVPMSVALHAKFKWKAAQRGLPMSKIVRELITDFIGDELMLSRDEPTVQDQIAERLAESLRA